MKKPTNVSDYDPNAPLPRVGTPWMWEPERAPSFCWVIEVLWNGEQWWVVTARELAVENNITNPAHRNEISRWWEAAYPIGWSPKSSIVHRPDLAVDGQRAGVCIAPLARGQVLDYVGETPV